MPHTPTPLLSSPPLRWPHRRLALHLLLASVGAAALPSSAQARLALVTAINRTASLRAQTQRQAKLYAQHFLNVQSARAQELQTHSRQQIQAVFADVLPHPWPAEVVQALELARSQCTQLDALLVRAPTKELVAQVSAQADKALEAAQQATLALEKQAPAPTARLVSLAGRLRWLSQRLAKNYYLLATGMDAKLLREQMAQDAVEFRQTLESLQKAPVATPAIRSQLELAQGQWVFFDAALQRPVDARGLDAMNTASERMLEVMQQLAGAYEAALKEIVG
ncbi:MAG: type IV pili methyl-accepting chemotaxis transducer N-terminal domain-containing protein [Comamonadaceae bacterium]|jgi:hypothetical protein|nr:type IV pili methyl-accepting chemotaxis transducer N-terminal domain-containing protein [Comamonadaceae bacterium]